MDRKICIVLFPIGNTWRLGCTPGYCKLQCMLREKGMLNKVSPMDLMDEYAKELMSEVPKKVRELDEKLELNLFPK